MQEAAPEFTRHFRAKVDFADSFLASATTRRASAIFVAHVCREHGLPHFSAAAVARLLEESHREAGDLTGERLGQGNGLTQIDLGDYRFGLPVRLSARVHAGEDGLLNIEREVELSGPIHDKGVFILQSYLAALFAHLAPLSLNASIAFEQQYHEVEGDSASCAELYALLSALSGLPLKQGIAVTGAVNQHGEVLPVGGINEKIEGWFAVCEATSLYGSQGVLIPARNRRHLMLAPRVVEAVANC